MASSNIDQADVDKRQFEKWKTALLRLNDVSGSTFDNMVIEEQLGEFLALQTPPGETATGSSMRQWIKNILEELRRRDSRQEEKKGGNHNSEGRAKPRVGNKAELERKLYIIKGVLRPVVFTDPLPSQSLTVEHSYERFHRTMTSDKATTVQELLTMAIEEQTPILRQYRSRLRMAQCGMIPKHAAFPYRIVVGLCEDATSFMAWSQEMEKDLEPTPFRLAYLSYMAASLYYWMEHTGCNSAFLDNLYQQAHTYTKKCAEQFLKQHGDAGRLAVRFYTAGAAIKVHSESGTGEGLHVSTDPEVIRLMTDPVVPLIAVWLMHNVTGREIWDVPPQRTEINTIIIDYILKQSKQSNNKRWTPFLIARAHLFILLSPGRSQTLPYFNIVHPTPP